MGRTSSPESGPVGSGQGAASRSQGTRGGRASPGYWDRRRPRYLFTGLMRCGVCGGGVVTWNRVRIGCANARNKGTCTNKTAMRRDGLETTVLEGLQHRLMDPALMEEFCRRLHAPAERAQLRAQRREGRSQGGARQGQPRSRPPRPGAARRPAPRARSRTGWRSSRPGRRCWKRSSPRARMSRRQSTRTWPAPTAIASPTAYCARA
jgi:hypothetical protein